MPPRPIWPSSSYRVALKSGNTTASRRWSMTLSGKYSTSDLDPQDEAHFGAEVFAGGGGFANALENEVAEAAPHGREIVCGRRCGDAEFAGQRFVRGLLGVIVQIVALKH